MLNPMSFQVPTGPNWVWQPDGALQVAEADMKVNQLHISLNCFVKAM